MTTAVKRSVSSHHQHGEFELSIQGNVIVADIHGSWNAQAAKAFDIEFRQLVQQLSQKSWAHLAYLDNWELGTSEMVAVIEELGVWCIEQGMKRAAHVYQPSHFKSLLLDDMVVEQQGEFQRRSFAEADQAIAWLAADGYLLNEG